MTALELNDLCERLYPLVARKLGNRELSEKIRSFSRGLPRKEPHELTRLLDEIMEDARNAGLG